MPRKCTLCGKPIILVPSAKERAERWGGKASDYEALFTTHSLCAYPPSNLLNSPTVGR